MTFSNEALWETGLANNQDVYGKGIYDFAKKWAELMESEINSGKPLKDVADKASHDADTDGITGFMYGAAVSILANTWIHGETLRKWHNGEYGVDEAVKGTVNPAILTIKTK